MSTISVDFSPAIMLTDAPDEIRRRVVATAAAVAFAHIVQDVKQRLHGTRQDYINGLQPPEFSSDGGTAVIRLEGVLPNMIENGWGGGDQRPFLIDRNPKRKVDKNGYGYANIPFSHKTADMPANVLSAARALVATKTAPGGGATLWGGRLKGGMVERSKPQHATDRFAGMYRTEKVYARAKQSQYRTFRRISWANKNGWIHPGIEQRAFLPAAALRVQMQMAHIVASAMRTS